MNGPLQHAIEQRIMTGTRYRGVPALKQPMDAWVYQELVHELRPDVIVEIGGNAGGSLLYLADLCTLTGHGHVVGVDIDYAAIHEQVALDPRITLLQGDAVGAYDEVEALVRGERVMVIEDSAHTTQHTLDVMRLYGQLVPVGGYLIVEDGVMPDVLAAIAAFLASTAEFVVDRSREWPVTWNPSGYLRRVA